MYDIPRLKDALPFCKSINFDAHKHADGSKKVIVICEYTNGMTAELTCPDMPKDTDQVIHLAMAGAFQCMLDYVTDAQFKVGSRTKSLKRGADGKIKVFGDPLSSQPPIGAPSKHKMLLTVPGVQDPFDGAKTSSQQAINGITNPSLLPMHFNSRSVVIPALPARTADLGTLDPVKAAKAASALDQLVKLADDEDDDDRALTQRMVRVCEPLSGSDSED